MNRRTMMTVTGLGGAAVLAAEGARGAAHAAEGSKTFVLVHGAWHGGWCWRDVRSALIAAGHRVFTPSLTGLGDRVHLRSPEINLTTHAMDIVNLMKFEELTDVILVGHSYAGHVVSVVADKAKERLRHIVFMDAVLATDGQSFLPPEVVAERKKTAKEGYLFESAGMQFLGIPEDHPNYKWVERNLTYHLLPCLAEVVRYENGGPAGVPKTFVRCMQNPRMASGDADPVKAMTDADPEWSYLTIDTGHDLMVTAPEETTEILLNIS